MNTEPGSTANKAKPARAPGRTKGRKRHGTERKVYERNSLYTLAAEFKRRNPQATAQDAWRHFAGLVGISTVLIAYDPGADVLTYAPDPGRVSLRTVARRTFLNQWYKISRESGKL